MAINGLTLIKVVQNQIIKVRISLIKGMDKHKKVYPIRTERFGGKLNKNQINVHLSTCC